MKKHIRIFTLSIAMMSLFTACDRFKSVTYKDGNYIVRGSEADDYGWKAFVKIGIKDGKIANVDFDYLDKNNKRKSQQEKYGKYMKNQTGTSPKEFCDTFSKSLIKKQDINKVEGVSGATYSFGEFKILAKTALENAKKGQFNESTVELK